MARPLALAEVVELHRLAVPAGDLDGLFGVRLAADLQPGRLGRSEPQDRWSTAWTRLFCTVTGMVALRPESLVSDLSISLTCVAEVVELALARRRGSRPPWWPGRATTWTSRGLWPCRTGVTTRDWSVRITWKLSSLSCVVGDLLEGAPRQFLPAQRRGVGRRGAGYAWWRPGRAWPWRRRSGSRAATSCRPGAPSRAAAIACAWLAVGVRCGATTMLRCLSGPAR